MSVIADFDSYLCSVETIGRKVLYVQRLVTLLALLLTVTFTGSGQHPRTYGTKLDDADLRKLQRIADVGSLDHIIATDSDTLGRGQVLLVIARATRTQWCLDVHVYTRHKDSFKSLWSVGEGMEENGICHEAECPDPTAQAVGRGEIALVLPVLRGGTCEDHVKSYRWDGRTFVLKAH